MSSQAFKNDVSGKDGKACAGEAVEQPGGALAVSWFAGGKTELQRFAIKVALALGVASSGHSRGGR